MSKHGEARRHGLLKYHELRPIPSPKESRRNSAGVNEATLPGLDPQYRDVETSLLQIRKKLKNSKPETGRVRVETTQK
jgi:hypothetical protein